MNQTRRDKDLLNWYSSDAIDTNVAHVISAVNVSVSFLDEDMITEHAKRSRSEDSSVGDLFDIATSTGGSSGSSNILNNWGTTSSEVINAVQALLEEAVTQEEPIGQAQGVTSPRVRSMGVSTSFDTLPVKTVTIPINESILTLLWKLHEKLETDKSAVYRPPDESWQVDASSRSRDSKQSQQESCDSTRQQQQQDSDVRTKTLNTTPAPAQSLSSSSSKASKPKAGACDDDSRIGNGAFFVRKLLDKICMRCAENRDILQALHVTSSKASSEKVNRKGNTLDER